MSAKQKKKYFMIYTGLFMVMACLVYATIALYGGKLRTFVERHDGFNQHVRALTYCGTWLRSIVKTLIREHRLVLPEWDFSIGFGSNILTTFHYYAIGDPLTLLSVLVPARYTVYLYSFLVLARNYLAGLAFSCFCIYMKKNNMQAVLAGTFLYIFCGHALGHGLLHPFFVNPMIYFPLVILGVEKIFHEERPYVLILSVFASALCSFYFFYMIVLLTVVYVLVRSIAMWKTDWKRILQMILKIGGYSLLGVMLSAFLLLPVLKLFLGSNRSAGQYTINLFYGKNYYKRLLAALCGNMSAGQRTHIGMGALLLPSVALLFAGRNRKKYPKELKIFCVLGFLFLVFPMAGHILNGFAYAANRWSWGYCFLLAFIIATVWEDFFSLPARDIAAIVALSAVYTFLISEYVWMRITLCFLWLILAQIALCGLMKAGRGKTYLCRTLFATVLVSVAGNAYAFFSADDYSGAKAFLPAKSVNRRMWKNADREVARLEEEEDLGFCRFTGSAVQRNSSVQSGVNGMQYYWSLSNSYMEDFFEDLFVRFFIATYHYDGLDDRTMLTTLADSAIYACKKDINEYVPYGYHQILEDETYSYYKNDYALPLAYTYSSYMKRDALREWNGVQKEEAMMQSVILETDAPGYTVGEPVLCGEELEYEITAYDAGVEIGDHAFIVTKPDATVTLRIEGKPEGENYLGFTGYDYIGTKGESYLRASGTDKSGDVWTKALHFGSIRDVRPTRIHDFMLNLGYREPEMDTVTLSFSAAGTYSYDTMFMWHQPMENYVAAVEDRRSDAWEEEQIGTDCVSGKVDLKEDKILCLSIPYDGGWTAYVDGKRQEVLRANVMFSAVLLKAGEHDVMLVYRTPGMTAGLAVTAAGFLLLLGLIWRRRRIVPKKMQ